MDGEKHEHRDRHEYIGRIRALIVRYAHHLGFFAFAAGFVLDSATLPAADTVTANIIVSGYLALAACAILLQQLLESRSAMLGTRRAPLFLSSFLPAATQLLFGALFSALLIFYMRSASLAGSWVFLFLFFAVAVGNELFRTRFARLEFQFTLLFLSLYVYAIYVLPLLFGTIGTKMFLLSGVVSATLAAAFFGVLTAVAPAPARRISRAVMFLAGGTLLVCNVLYFARLIPPIPLVLVDRGVYHLVVRGPDGNYRALEEAPTKTLWGPFGRLIVFHRTPGSSAYFFSAVYAPTQLQTPIVHEWQYHEPVSDTWVMKSRIIFPIIGGREAGYRGYSEKSYIDAGRWRVIVKTSEGREIGRMSFVVVDAPAGRVTLHERVL